MLFSSHQNIEEDILLSLQKGPATTKGLLQSLQQKRGGTTKQGMYAAIRKLVREENVIKHKQKISLNVTWLEKLNAFASLAGHFYASAERTGGFLSLQDGEKIKYEFRSLSSTDAFWNHVLYLLIEANPGAPFLSYVPHCWFFIARAESERTTRDHIVKNNSQYLVICGGNTPLDKAVSAEFDGKKSQYYMRNEPLFSSPAYHINVIGDFVIEVWIDSARAATIEQIYRSRPHITPAVVDDLHAVVLSKGKTKFVISRNKKRAQKLTTTFAKPFYIPKR